MELTFNGQKIDIPLDRRKRTDREIWNYIQERKKMGWSDDSILLYLIQLFRERNIELASRLAELIKDENTREYWKAHASDPMPVIKGDVTL